MRALVCHHLAEDRSGLRFETEWPEPAPPGIGEVTVAISHASLNFPDLLTLSGGYQFKPQLPFVPGTEAAGIVIATGAGAETLLGQQVIVGARGCFAERVTIAATAVRPLPPGLTAAEAAAFTVGALTAWVGLMLRGRLIAGERVLVTGAGGGMGLAAVALAAAEGAEVIAVASSEERLALARAAGAQETLRIDRATPEMGRRDVDIVFDPVGGALAMPAIRTLARGGRYLIIGFAGGRPDPFPLNRALIKEIEVIGVRAGEQGRQRPETAAGFIAAIDARAAALRPPIGLEVPLEQGDAAFAAMAAGTLLGKAVLRIG
jgi:NADPH2:quinone reductase